MLISVTDAKGRLTDLVKRAEAGEEIVLTRHGRETVKLVAVASQPGPEARRRLLEALQASAVQKALPGPSAARSQDFLYDADGLPN
jgi:prevent-host-death family protein